MTASCSCTPATRTPAFVPGTAGTVTGYDARLAQLAVAWDDGSTLAMLLHDGDHVRPLARPGLRPGRVPSADGCQPLRKERTVNLGEHAALPGGHRTGGMTYSFGAYSATRDSL